MSTLRSFIVASLLFSCTVSLGAKQGPQSAKTIADEHYVNGLLHKYHLDVPSSPFSYRHKTEIYNDLLGKSMPLPAETEALACKLHAHLNNSFFFKDIGMIRGTSTAHKVRAYQLKSHPSVKGHGQLLQAQTNDGHTIHGTWLNRNSDTLIVAGAGFTQHREQMAPFGDIFSEYDVLTYDYRGHGIESSHPLRPQTWTSLSKRMIGFDRKRVTLGQDEDRDVFAIVSEVKRHKKYNKIIGIGICYSGLILTKTAAKHPTLFNKLILDGTWFSLQHATELIARDPGLLSRPQVRSHLADNWLVNQRWFQRGMLNIAQRFLNVNFNTTSVLDYAPNLPPELEVLFIHGKDDVLIPRELFEILWHATPCRHKTALITSNEHVWNFLKQKELYKEVCELFIQTTYEQFTHLLATPEALLDRKTIDLHNKLG